MLRTARIIDSRPITLRTMAYALAGTAIIVALTACGTEVKDVKTVNGESATASSTPVTPVMDTSTPVVPSEPSVVQPVALTDAEAVYREKRYADAAGMFEQYVQGRPNNPWGHYMLGLSAWKSGDLDRAEQAFVRSLELDPKHVKTLLNLARVHLDQARPKDALERVNAAIALDSASADAYRLLGRSRAALGQPNEAVTAYEVALSRDPSDVWSMNNMGLLLIQQGHHEDALGPLARAVQLDSTVAVFQNNLGIALERTGRYAMAAEAYRGALRANEGYTKAKLSLGRVEGRREDPSVTPVDLAVLAETFDRQIRGVQMGGPVAPPDSGRVVRP